MYKADHVERAVSLPTGGGRKPIARTGAWTILGIVALFAFINLLGDWRRKQNALRQTSEHAAVFTQRLGQAGTLPLNFDPEIPEAKKESIFQIEWLTTDDARALRTAREPILVLWTVPLRQVTAPNGRGVVWFRNGRFEPEWMSLRGFDAAMAAQASQIRTRRTAEERGSPP